MRTQIYFHFRQTLSLSYFFNFFNIEILSVFNKFCVAQQVSNKEKNNFLLFFKLDEVHIHLHVQYQITNIHFSLWFSSVFSIWLETYE